MSNTAQSLQTTPPPPFSYATRTCCGLQRQVPNTPLQTSSWSTIRSPYFAAHIKFSAQQMNASLHVTPLVQTQPNALDQYSPCKHWLRQWPSRPRMCRNNAGPSAQFTLSPHPTSAGMCVRPMAHGVQPDTPHLGKPINAPCCHENILAGCYSDSPPQTATPYPIKPCFPPGPHGSQRKRLPIHRGAHSVHWHSRGLPINARQTALR